MINPHRFTALPAFASAVVLPTLTCKPLARCCCPTTEFITNKSSRNKVENSKTRALMMFFITIPLGIKQKWQVATCLYLPLFANTISSTGFNNWRLSNYRSFFITRSSSYYNSSNSSGNNCSRCY